MKEQKIAACLILGDAYNEDELKTLFDSLKGQVHGIYVNFNGKKRNSVSVFTKLQQLTEIPVHLEHFKWEDNFGKARQQSFDMVPKEDYDWYLWIDSDDKFVVDAPLQEMFESLDSYTMGVFVRYDYAIDPISGLVVVEQWRERFLSTKMNWKWEYSIHEVCKGTVGSIQFAKRDHCHIEHLRKNGEDRGARDRNRRIISKAMKDNPEESRYVFYFASEMLAEVSDMEQSQEKIQIINSAIHAFEKYKDMTEQVNDDFYIAQNRIAELYYMRRDFISSLDAHLECIAIYPEWPDAYVGAAKCCMELHNWGRMKSFAEMASKCPKPMTAAGIETMTNTFYPVFLRAIAEYELGEYDLSLKDFKAARKIWNTPDGQIDEKIKEIQSFKKAQKVETLDERKALRGTRPEKSIAFFTNPLPFSWHPKVQSGAGAELCVTEIAKRFQADGWRVAVFGTPGANRGVYEGIEWWDSEEYNPMEPFTVFVSSRAPAPFEGNINSKLKVLWMHDVNVGPTLTRVTDKIDKIIGLTNWHVSHLMKLYGLPGTKMVSIPNGINMERFPVDRSDDPNGDPKFIWSSSADRGLDTLLGLWPVIKDKYPTSELQIFYGWGIIDSVIEENHRRGIYGTWVENFKKSIVGQIEWLGGEEGGIYQNGRVDQNTLAEAMYQSNYWPYTTGFMETFCITAVECMAAGVIPITSNLAALGELLQKSPNIVTGWPMNRDYQVKWLKRLDSLVENEDNRLAARKAGREMVQKFDWDSAYEKWNNMLINSGISS